MAETRFGSFDDLLDITKEPLLPIILQLRKEILTIHSEANEVVRLGDRAATYGVGPRKMIEGYCYLMPHAKWVNLGFFRGAILPDPDKLLEGTGKLLRHVKIRDLKEVKKAGIRKLIKAAYKERLDALK